MSLLIKTEKLIPKMLSMAISIKQKIIILQSYIIEKTINVMIELLEKELQHQH